MKRRDFVEQLTCATCLIFLPSKYKPLMNPTDIKIISTIFSVHETINKLVTFLEKNGATIYARIDQQRELNNVGIVIKPYEVILFGNPKSGGPILVINPIAGVELPLKIIAWQDEYDKVWIAYNDIFHLARNYNIPPDITLPLDLGPVIRKAME